MQRHEMFSGAEGSRTPVQTARYMNLYAYSVVI